MTPPTPRDGDLSAHRLAEMKKASVDVQMPGHRGDKKGYCTIAGAELYRLIAEVERRRLIVPTRVEGCPKCGRNREKHP